MKDTSPEVNEWYFREMMKRTPSERFAMGMSMMTTAKEIVWSTMPEGMEEPERTDWFCRRFYGQSFTEITKLPLSVIVERKAGKTSVT